MNETPDEPVEHFGHAHHAHESHDPFLKRVAITVVVLAVLAAFVGSLETLESGAALSAKNEAVLLQDKATDQWNFFQAKSIKKNLYEVAGALGPQGASEFGKNAQKNANDEEEIQKKARELENTSEDALRESDRHETRHHWLTISATLLHIAIATATITIVAGGQRWLWYVALVLGTAGTAVASGTYL